MTTETERTALVEICQRIEAGAKPQGDDNAPSAQCVLDDVYAIAETALASAPSAPPSEVEALKAELATIDAVIARRPALDKPTRAENIEHAITTAGRMTDRVSRLEVERDVITRALPGWAHDTDDVPLSAQVGAAFATMAAEIEKLKKELAEAKFAPLGDNHHNAAACPYCSPKLAPQGQERTALIERPAIEHELKTWREYFDAVSFYGKQFEVRRDDRDFRTGDTVRLREWDDATGYSGRQLKFRIGYVLRDFVPGNVVFALEALSSSAPAPATAVSDDEIVIKRGQLTAWAAEEDALAISVMNNANPHTSALHERRARCLRRVIAMLNRPPRVSPPDVVCQHGTAMDVHCCNCHSGFLFDSESCVCVLETSPSQTPEERPAGETPEGRANVNERDGCLAIERVYELLEEFDIPETDTLKHTLEDHERWRRDIVSLSIKAEAWDRLKAAQPPALSSSVMGEKQEERVIGWRCIQCGTFKAGTSIEIAAALCNCGVGLGRWAAEPSAETPEARKPECVCGHEKSNHVHLGSAAAGCMQAGCQCYVYAEARKDADV